jgi:hypothetical protein
MKPNGMVIWEGSSKLNGAPIAAILTGLSNPSANTKTGDMLQLWILSQGIAPVEAVKTGADAAICGDCPHRAGSCYVNVGQAPQGIWKAYRRGAYGPLRADRLQVAMQGRMVRLGAYGDPAAVPVPYLAMLADMSAGWTGYTHQWRLAPEALKRFAMASCDSPEDYAEAKAHGWRTFRTRLESEPMLEGEIICPASDEGGSLVQCAKCGLCSGIAGKGARGKSIAIIAHGAAPKVRAYESLRGIGVRVAA